MQPLRKASIIRADARNIRRAVDILRAGGLVAFPTETVYGLGARAFDGAAARRIYHAKGRPSDNPLIVHVDGEKMLELVVRRVPRLARRLIATFWPGPLTLVLEKAARVPFSVTAGHQTVAVRCPSHPVARALISALGEPIAAPSANRSGRPSPTRADHVADDFGKRVTLILDGGPCRLGLESTIVDSRGRRPVLLRPGTLTPEAISRIANISTASSGCVSPPSPGTRYRHYAPSCRVKLIAPSAVRSGIIPGFRRRDGLLHISRWGGPRPAFVRRVSAGPAAYARALFASLRAAEKAEIQTLFVETLPERGIGRAVMDRLRRAAEISSIDPWIGTSTI